MRISRDGSIRALRVTLPWVTAYAIISVAHYVVRGFADDFGRPTYSPGAVDAAVFGGSAAHWLQGLIPDGGVVQLVIVGLYASWFSGLIVLQGVVLARCGPRSLARLIALHTALLLVADLIFILLPTRPPWMDSGVTRVIAGAGASGDRIPDNNQLAAVPSLHVAMPLLYMLWFARQAHPSLRWAVPVIGIWTLAISLAVVYGGEHYVTDVVAGAICAGAVYVAGTRASAALAPRARRLRLLPLRAAETMDPMREAA